MRKWYIRVFCNRCILYLSVQRDWSPARMIDEKEKLCRHKHEEEESTKTSSLTWNICFHRAQNRHLQFLKSIYCISKCAPFRRSYIIIESEWVTHSLYDIFSGWSRSLCALLAPSRNTCPFNVLLECVINENRFKPCTRQLHDWKRYRCDRNIFKLKISMNKDVYVRARCVNAAQRKHKHTNDRE